MLLVRELRSERLLGGMCVGSGGLELRLQTVASGELCDFVDPGGVKLDLHDVSG